MLRMPPTVSESTLVMLYVSKFHLGYVFWATRRPPEALLAKFRNRAQKASTTRAHALEAGIFVLAVPHVMYTDLAC